MGSTSPSRPNSRTNGPAAECSSARTEGSRHRGERAATNLHFLKDWERSISRDQSLMAHLLLAFSRLAWNSANARAVAWLQNNSAPASALSRLLLALDSASSCQGRLWPTGFERRRNRELPARPAIPSPHHPSCPGGGQFQRARGAPRGYRDRRPEQREILSPPRRRVQRTAPAGRVEGA